MSDEISFNLRFNVENGTYKPGAISISGLNIDQSAQGAVEGIHTATTSENNAIAATGLTDPGVLFLRNVESSTAKICSWGFTTGQMYAELRSGEFAVVRTTTAAGTAGIITKCTAGAGGCKVHYRWLED
jgi:hypothetical protein